MNILAIELSLQPVVDRVVSREWRYNLIVNTATLMKDPSGRTLVEPRPVAANVPVDGVSEHTSPWDVLIRVCELEGVKLPFISHHAVVIIESPGGSYAVHNFSPQVV